MKCIIFGGSGEVGGAVVRALVASAKCDKLTMLGRRIVPAFQGVEKVEQAMVDTSAADFEDVVKAKAQGHDAAISCIGIGSGTLFMSEERMMEVEVGMVGKFARGCKAAGIGTFELLTAWGINETSAKSPIKPFRVMGKKLEAVLSAGFARVAVFKPGVIEGNSHTPSWMSAITGLIPGSFGLGNIRQEDLGRAFAAHLEKRAESQEEPVVYYENRQMRELIRE